MKVSLRIALALCKRFEGLRLKPYLCPAGVPTIGYGTVWKPDGTKVTMQDPAITEAQAELWLISALSNSCIISAIKSSPALITNEPALGAITDFIYNLGSSRYRSSTLRKRIDEQDWDEARIEIMRWVRGGGKILPGLVKRRIAEAEYLK